jgi:hypothetical protein
MKVLTFLLALAVTAAASGENLRDFALSDQHGKTRSYRFPKAKVTVMTVADHKGSDQLAPWIQRLHDRYADRIDIDGVADVSIIPSLFHEMFRQAFKKQLTYSVMLDWRGDVVKQFAPQKGVANIFVIDRNGRILRQFTGPVSDAAIREIQREVERAMTVAAKPRDPGKA